MSIDEVLDRRCVQVRVVPWICPAVPRGRSRAALCQGHTRLRRQALRPNGLLTGLTSTNESTLDTAFLIGVSMLLNLGCGRIL